MTLDNMTGITKGSYTGGDLFCKSQLITCNRVKECNGVCPFEDALKHADQAVKAIKSLPYAEPMTGWIPVSERLPNRGKDVLVTRKYYGKDDCNKDSIYVEISACYADGEEWHGYSDEYKMSPKNHKVIAWMPLPEPYDCGAKMGGDSDG